MTIQVPGYSIQRLIGKGGMASVYLATQHSLERPVALKILNKFDNETQIQRFFNEGKIIASLEQRNIITIHDLGEVNGRCFLAMEYLEGGDLKQRINEGLTADDALKLTALIARCLEFVHDKGVIHRDIKPENILFRKDGSLVLTDFGVAKQLRSDSSLTIDDTALGSPYYFSPEQARNKPLDARTDIYSLGIILYEMLTGERPFQGDSPIEIIVAHLTTEAPPLPQHLARYQELLERMMAKDPADRFESATALVDELAHIQQSPAQKSPLKAFARRSAPKASNSERQSRKSVLPFVYIALGLSFAAVSTGAWFLYPMHSPTKHSSEVAVETVAEPERSPAPDPAIQTEIRRLVAQGEILLKNDRLTLSSLRQAHEIYDRALGLDPKNIAALQGMARVKSLDESVRDQIARHLVKANKALRAFRLTSPANDNAMLHYSRVLLLDSGNEEAGQGKYRVADAYGDLAEAHLQEFEYAEAKTNLNKGLAIHPTSPRLLALQEQTNAFTDAPRRFFGKVKSIFD